MTTQVLESVWYQGHNYQIRAEPLASLFDETLPTVGASGVELSLSSIYEFDDDPYENKIQRPNFSSIIMCSACWRGYIGEWVVDSDQLYLKELQGLDDKSVRAMAFPNRTDLVHAEWFSGILHLIYDLEKSDDIDDDEPFDDSVPTVPSHDVSGESGNIDLVIRKGIVLESAKSPSFRSGWELRKKYTQQF